MKCQVLSMQVHAIARFLGFYHHYRSTVIYDRLLDRISDRNSINATFDTVVD